MDRGLSRTGNPRGERGRAGEHPAASIVRPPRQPRFSPVACAMPNCMGDRRALPQELPLLVEHVEALNFPKAPPRTADADSFPERGLCSREVLAPPWRQAEDISACRFMGDTKPAQSSILGLRQPSLSSLLGDTKPALFGLRQIWPATGEELSSALPSAASAAETSLGGGK